MFIFLLFDFRKHTHSSNSSEIRIFNIWRRIWLYFVFKVHLQSFIIIWLFWNIFDPKANKSRTYIFFFLRKTSFDQLNKKSMRIYIGQKCLNFPLGNTDLFLFWKTIKKYFSLFKHSSDWIWLMLKWTTFHRL